MTAYIPRAISDAVTRTAQQFPVVTLTGPRQSGKSTLLRHLFPHYAYVSLEEIDNRLLAHNDPRAFLRKYPGRVVIDEVQRVPQLLSYIQGRVDEVDEPGMYLLSGSHNFLLMQSVDQSLAGRSAVMTLLPLSRGELHGAGLLPDGIDEQIFRGFYPRLYQRDIRPEQFYQSYVTTYVERDVRLMQNITSLDAFTRMLRLCAARIGQLLNISNLANECGISTTAVRQWLSVLQASYIVYTLQPNYNNYNKRLVKTPKLYFYDTGLACHLLGIESAGQIDTHWAKGALYENLVINQHVKDAYNGARRPDLTFWRDSSGTEVDLIDTRRGVQHAYEIKSAYTFRPDFFKGLEQWARLSGAAPQQLNVVYNGQPMPLTQGNVISFPDTF